MVLPTDTQSIQHLDELGELFVLVMADDARSRIKQRFEFRDDHVAIKVLLVEEVKDVFEFGLSPLLTNLSDHVEDKVLEDVAAPQAAFPRVVVARRLSVILRLAGEYEVKRELLIFSEAAMLLQLKLVVHVVI